MTEDQKNKTLKEIMESHELWLEGHPSGVQADFSGMEFKNVNFTESNFKDSDFRRSNFKDSDFRWSTFGWSDFEGSNFRGSDFKDVRGLRKAQKEEDR